ncbi:hypothetical protein [Salinarimonas rosea]|uniref:hypothetical protein n=1 Tax=Salinarimonas rosea TaxID=552063 RepID=UPI0004181C06|nr:hypothetical protein [Salinarimonas rosea]
MLLAWSMVVSTIGLTVVAQLLVKWRVGSVAPPAGGAGDYALWILRVFTDPYVVAAFLMAGTAAAAWFVAMTRLPLSLAYPFMALTFPMVVLGSWAFFDDTVSTLQIAGVALIVGGVAFVGLGAR